MYKEEINEKMGKGQEVLLRAVKIFNLNLNDYVFFLPRMSL